jgi:ribose transport system ATP-binding protein
VRDLSKRLGATQALDQVSVRVEHGEIRALVGENGSGKSTLIKVLSGYYVPDSGSITVDGNVMDFPIQTRKVKRSRLSFVQQDLGLILSLTALENFELHEFAYQNSWCLNWRRRRARFQSQMELYGLDIDSKTPVNELSRTKQTLLAIARAVQNLGIEDLSADVRSGRSVAGMLVLDEVTTSLPHADTTHLFSLMRSVAGMGVGILFVSHDLTEVKEIAQSITVLRNGRVVGDQSILNIGESEISRMMLGGDVNTSTGELAPKMGAQDKGNFAVVDNLEGGALRRASFTVKAGEILGLTGLLGSGYEEVGPLLFGASKAKQGTLSISGEAFELRLMEPKKAMRIGIGLVPEDRKTSAGIDALSLEENLSIPVVSKFQRWSALSHKKLKKRAYDLMTQYQVRPLNPEIQFGSLSGGNQQKVVLAKWMALDPQLLLLQEPTQGVDIGARWEIFRIIKDSAKSKGMSIVVSSTDLQQLCDLCDRVLVFYRGEVIAHLEGSDISKHAIDVAMLQGGVKTS